MEVTMTKHIRPESDLYAAHFLHEEILGGIDEKRAEPARAGGIDPWYHDAARPEDSWYEDAPPAYRIDSVLIHANSPDEAYERASAHIAATSDDEGEWYYAGDGSRQWQRLVGLLELDSVYTSSKELPAEVKKEAVPLSIIDWTKICDPRGRPRVPPKEELAVFKTFTVVR